MLKKIIILSILTLVLCPAVIAFDYYEITRNAKNDAYYIDLKSGFDKPANNVIAFWVKKNIDNSTPYSKEKPITHSQNYFTVNCSNYSYFVDKIAYYNYKNEQVDGKTIKNPTYTIAEPGSLGYKIAKFGCWYKNNIYDTQMAPGHTKYDKNTCPDFCHDQIKYCTTFYTCPYTLP